MSHSLVVIPSAQLEFDEAINWYKVRNPVLAAEFVAEVRRVLSSVCVGPEKYGLVSDGARLARTKKFSYAVYFLVDNGVVVVISILHTSRDPSIWRKRLADEDP